MDPGYRPYYLQGWKTEKRKLGLTLIGPTVCNEPADYQVGIDFEVLRVISHKEGVLIL